MGGVIIQLDEVRRRNAGVGSIVEKKPARVFAITSGKGGVGKTTTTVNLGLAMVREGKRVLLLDADLGLANINIMLGFQPAMTLRDVLNGSATLDDVIAHVPGGLDVIPASSGFPDMTNLGEGERIALVNAFEKMAYRYDIMLVDTAAGIGDNVLYFNAAAEDVIVIIDSEPTTLTDAYALMKVLSKEHGVKEFHVISNRVAKGSDGRTPFAQLSATTSKFLKVRLKYQGSVEADEQVSEAIRAQRPFVELFPSARTSLDFTRLAKKLLAEPQQRTPSGSMQFFFRALLGESASSTETKPKTKP